MAEIVYGEQSPVFLSCVTRLLESSDSMALYTGHPIISAMTAFSAGLPAQLLDLLRGRRPTVSPATRFSASRSFDQRQ